MDSSLDRDHRYQLQELVHEPTLDLHIRVSENKVEALLWADGKRYRLLGVRDEEPAADGRDEPVVAEGD
jgi:hypothetical protein